jgi:hypothetical protein
MAKWIKIHPHAIHLWVTFSRSRLCSPTAASSYFGIGDLFCNVMSSQRWGTTCVDFWGMSCMLVVISQLDLDGVIPVGHHG